MQGALERELAAILGQIDANRDLARGALERLLAFSGMGTRLAGGWSVALAGRPNVGKSRLLNALAGYDRAIVDPTPGTTRDVITVRTAFDGWPVELADTAGLREGGDPIETAGIALARARHDEADLTLLLLDRSEPLTGIDKNLLARSQDTSSIVVASKVDLPPAWTPWDDSIVEVSAVRSDGLERLAGEIATRLVPIPPPPGGGVPFRPSHVRRLEKALAALTLGNDREAADHLRAISREGKGKGTRRQ
ncbi:MAG: hypothetical protein NVSMB9_33610 [Isosphaeraceae bacterium]